MSLKICIFMSLEFADNFDVYMSNHTGHITNGSVAIGVTSEVHKFREYNEENISTVMLNFSSLHPNTELHLRSLTNYGNLRMEELLKLKNVKSDTIDKLSEHIAQKWRFEEWESLFDSFRRCERTALLLPTDLCENVAWKLNGLGLKHVFVGKETLVKVTLEFRETWLVPPFITRRIQTTVASGIWGHLGELFDSGENIYTWKLSPSDLSKPRMDGHLLLVFIVLICGLIIAGFIFAFEFWVDAHFPKSQIAAKE